MKKLYINNSQVNIYAERILNSLKLKDYKNFDIYDLYEIFKNNIQDVIMDIKNNNKEIFNIVVNTLLGTIPICI